MKTIGALIAIAVLATWPTPGSAGDVLNARVGCVEVYVTLEDPPTVGHTAFPAVGHSARRKSIQKDSVRAEAINKAKRQSRTNATNDLEDFCKAKISAAIATTTCTEATRHTPLDANIAFELPPVAAFGRAAVNAQSRLPGVGKLCTVLRDLDETSVTHKAGVFTATFFSRANCGVACTRD